MSRNTLFFTGGGKITNQPTTFYNKYKPGGGGIGGASISVRRARNRLATVCNGNRCFPCYTKLGLYSQNPNGYVPCEDISPTPTPTVPPLQGSLTFNFEFTPPFARTFSITEPPSPALINAILPVTTVPGVFEITHTATIVDNRVYVEITTLLYEQPSYTSNFGFTFNKVYRDPDLPGPLPLHDFYNAMYNLTFTSSTNCPFNKAGSQFKELTTDFTILSDFKPYFLPGTSLTSCFADCSNFNSDISIWDVSNVIDMSYLFQNASSFNQDISPWDVSNVRTMESMFKDATSFKQDISNWNPYLCTNMIDIFSGVDINNPDSIDNQDNYNAMLESWGVTKLSNMQSNVTFNGGNSKYSSSEAVTGRNNLTNTQNWTITDLGDSSVYIPGTLEFSYVYAGTIDEDTVISNVPVLTYTNVFEIQNIVVDRLYIPIDDVTNVTVTINSKFYEYAAYPSDFGFTFNNVASFYNSNVSDLNMISSSNFPFSKMGYQFNNLSGSFIIQSGFQPYFLPGTSLRDCFQSCSNFNSNISNWDTINVTNMSNMFANAILFNEPIGSWITTNVTDMRDMFYNAWAFNGDIGSWITSSVTDMREMFYGAYVFNIDISSWNTSNVTNMSYMFANAYAFDQPIGSWNTANVTNMSYMFQATVFNQPISLWNTSNVISMDGMFYGNTVFNQLINTSGSNWDTSNVVDMSYMFLYASAFDQPIGLWITSKVTNMSDMFSGATTFNKPIGSWDTSNVTNMSYMFEGATAFKQDLSNWTPSSCTNMTGMFSGVDINNPKSNTNQDNYNALLKSWGMDKLSSMQSSTTEYTISFNGGNSKYSSSDAILGHDALTTQKLWVITDGGIAGPTTYGTIQFSYVYEGEISESTVISNLPVLSLTDVFEITPSVTITPNDNLPGPHLVEVTISSVLYESSSYPSDFGFTFNTSNAVSFHNDNTSNLTFISSNNFPFSKMGNQFTNLTGSFTIEPGFNPYFLPGTSLRFCFGYCPYFNSPISNWDTLKVTNMSYMFSNATAFNQPINYNPATGAWNTENVTDMSYMFYAANSFDNTIDLWNTASVTNMNGMFNDAVAFNQSINYNPATGAWNTSLVTDMSYMFSGATSFNTEIDLWEVLNVTNMSYMFSKATSFTGDISSWNVSKVTNMSNMFSGGPGNIPIFNGDISSWDTSSVILMNGMFYEAPAFNQPIGSWNTSNVTDMSFMFYQATTFNQDITSWNTTKVTNMALMFWNAINFNIDISGWTVSNVLYMDNMFEGATAFKQDLSNWTPSSCTNMTGMFSGVDINDPDSDTNQNNYNALLKSWGIDKLSSMQDGITFNGGNSNYSSSDAITGRDNLITQKGWTITDEGVV